MEDRRALDDITWGSINTFGPKLTQGYMSMALGRNGLLYALPESKGRVLEIDVERKQVREIGEPFKGDTMHHTLVASKANGCLYAAPFNARRVLEIDPAAGTVKMIGPPLEAASTVGMVEAMDGCLYAPPLQGGHVLQVNPLSGVVQLIGDAILPGSYGKPAVANNGRIYAPPLEAEHVLEIDPYTAGCAIRLIGEAIERTDANINGFMYAMDGIRAAANGRLYAPPHDSASDILEIDPEAGSVSRISGDRVDGAKGFQYGCEAAGSGSLYFAAGEKLQEVVLLKIDPSTTPATITSRRVADQLLQVSKSCNASYEEMAAGSNGSLYLLPVGEGCVVEINTALGVAREIGPTLLAGYCCPVQVGDCIVALPRVTNAQLLMISHHALQPKRESISAALGFALASGALSDVTVTTTNGREHKAHKLILALRSSVFESMFRAKMREAEYGLVLLGDFSDRVSDMFMQFLYTGDATAAAHDISTAELCELSALAHKYAVSDLLASCSTLLSETLRLENAACVLRLADGLQLAELKQVCLDYIVANPQVMDTDEWAQDVTHCASLVTEVAEALGGFRRKRRKISELEFPASSDWSKLTVPKLRRACAERGLAQDGKKESLLERLRA